MATQTTNIGLTQAAESEYYSVDVVNENLEKIDTALGDIQNAVGGSNSVSDRIGSHDDTEAGTVFGDLNIVKVQTGQISTDAAEIKTKVNGNADKLGAMKKVTDSTNTVAATINTRTVAMEEDIDSLLGKADNINTVASSNGTKLDSALSKIDTANTQITNTRNLVSTVNTNVSSNGTKLDTLADKSDVISDQVQTVGNDVNTVKTDVASIKTTVESTSGKVDTAITNIEATKSAVESNGTKLDTLQAQTEVKPFGWTKKATIGSGAWQTAVEITGSGTIAKALSLADAAYQMRVTVDDEVVFYCNGAKGKWAGTIEDFASNSNAVYAPVMTYAGTLDITSLNSSSCVWLIGCPGADAISAAVCFVSGGLRFYKNFKLEFYNLQPGAVTVTGTITKGSTVTTL